MGRVVGVFKKRRDLVKKLVLAFIKMKGGTVYGLELHGALLIVREEGKLDEVPRFKASRFGPFSDKLEEIVEELIEEGKLTTPVRSVDSVEASLLRRLMLTERGLDEASEAIEYLRRERPDVYGRLERLAAMYMEELLYHVYTSYPRYRIVVRA